MNKSSARVEASILGKQIYSQQTDKIYEDFLEKEMLWKKLIMMI